MHRGRWLLVPAALAIAAPVAAQDRPNPLPVGTEAPNFTLPAATRDGVSGKPATLLDFRGQTVVLAFFFKARTGG